MAKRKPLSAEEKRCKLLELFHETSDVFQLKDLERLAARDKGIVQQSVKTTLQELVDSGQVRTEKIAGSLYFWAFPSEALNLIKQQLEQNENQISKLQCQLEKAQSQLEAALTAQLDGEEASLLAHEIDMLNKEKTELQQRVVALKQDIDYDGIAAKQQDAKKILEATNRWTDNIFLVKSWCKRKFDKEERELNKAFGIADDLDYLDA